MKVTLKDVANLAGVSITTVSYVVNDGPRPVSYETRAVVLDAMQQLGYQSKRKQKTDSSVKNLTIGVIVPNTNSTFFGEAIEGIEAFLYTQGHHCIISSTWSDLAIEKRLIRDFTKLVDGLIITPAAELCPAIEQLPKQGIPTILMDRQIPSTLLSGVGIDNYQITKQAVQLLFDASYEKIALINGSETIDTMKLRLDGYRDSLQNLGLVYNPQWVVRTPFSATAGREAALSLMSLSSPPDALICTSTDTTAGILQGLSQISVRIPDDVAIVCYGDTIWGSLLSPSLTTIAAPARLMGETSARLLLNTISNPHPTETRHIFLETEVILRNSHRRQRPRGGNSVSG